MTAYVKVNTDPKLNIGRQAAKEESLLLQARQYSFQFPRPSLIMGILNVTPDSFSDGGKFSDPERALEHALAMQTEGADIIDIGGESTRPHSQSVPIEEELRRVLPVIEKLQGKLSIPVSIDTTKPTVAEAALDMGACMINDVSAGQNAQEMGRLAAKTGCAYVLMHSQGTPDCMQRNPAYGNVVAEINNFFEQNIASLLKDGVRIEQIILDPGIGFGKTVEHNLQLLACLESFKRWGRPVMLGASRKSFIGGVCGQTEPGERLGGSLAAACWGQQCGIGIFRVHDVAATRQALAVQSAIMGYKGKNEFA